MNDIVLEDKLEGNPSVHTKNKKESKKWHWTTNEDKLQKVACSKKILETTWKKFYVLRVFCVNDNVEVDLENNQMIRCILCYQNLVIRINPRIQTRNRLIYYYKTNGILKKKTCGCKTHSYCKKVSKRNEQCAESIWRKTTIKEKSKYVWRGNL